MVFNSCLRLVFGAALAAMLTACAGGRFSTPNASGHYVSSPVSCVPYARDVSGIQIYGDAYTWWNKAYPRYTYGSMPQLGAVLVLEKTNRLRYGHLAVVKKIINQRQIDVTHSNWGSDREHRRIIYESMRAEDISPNNSWTSVRFWNKDANVFGFPYAAKGFIYKNYAPASVMSPVIKPEAMPQTMSIQDMSQDAPQSLSINDVLDDVTKSELDTLCTATHQCQ
jgi:surface antigen